MAVDRIYGIFPVTLVPIMTTSTTTCITTWTPEMLTQLATGYWPSATLMAAVEIGLFDALTDAPQPADELALMLDVAPAMLPALLDALVSLGILIRTSDARYALAPSAQSLLSRKSHTCMIDALQYNIDLYKQWAHLPDVIRTGQPVVPQHQQLGGDKDRTRRFVYGMEAKARAFTPFVAPLMIPLLTTLLSSHEHATLLDVGSGPGTLSRYIAEQMQGLDITLLDLPEVLNIAQEISAASTAADRIVYHPADYRNDLLPGGFDAAVFAGALHQESTESASVVIENIRRALKPGGSLFIVDLMLDDTRTGPVFSALFQLSMRLMRPAARVFSTGELITLLHQHGFTHIQSHKAPNTPYCLVQAVRG
jgi:SAM-dependent methyltransferase